VRSFVVVVILSYSVAITGCSHDAVAQVAGPGDWVMPARDHSGTRFSPLDRITSQNVGQLGVKATFSTGYVRGHEAAPLVAQGTMYIVTPFPNILYALDLTQPGAPVKWKYDPKPLAAAQGVACCDVVNRGAVYADGVVRRPLLLAGCRVDGHGSVVERVLSNSCRWTAACRAARRSEKRRRSWLNRIRVKAASTIAASSYAERAADAIDVARWN
jgi:hypothetical protein